MLLLHREAQTVENTKRRGAFALPVAGIQGNAARRQGVPSEVRPLVEALNPAQPHPLHMIEGARTAITSDAARNCAARWPALKVPNRGGAALGRRSLISRDKADPAPMRGIDRATRLVDQLLTLSRLDSSPIICRMAEISLERAAAVAVMDIIYHPAQQANIDVRLQLNAHDVIRTDSRYS